MTTPPPVTCAACGREPRQDERTGSADVPWTWSAASGEDGRAVLCDSCTRQHAPSIEAQLDPDWW